MASIKGKGYIITVSICNWNKTIAEKAEQFDAHPNQISEWKQQLQESAIDVFGSNSKAKAAAPDLKILHAKIGQFTLEEAFAKSCEFLFRCNSAFIFT